jgi:hypothetical protein
MYTILSGILNMFVLKGPPPRITTFGADILKHPAVPKPKIRQQCSFATSHEWQPTKVTMRLIQSQNKMLKVPIDT